MNVNFKLTIQLADLRRERVRVRKRLSRAVLDTGEAVKARIEAAMRLPKSGRTYVRRQGGSHQASAPGEAPAIETRRLIESGRVEPTGELSADIVYDAPEALPLEYGTVRMAARPFLGPALLAELPDFEHRVADAVQGVGASGRVRTVNPR